MVATRFYNDELNSQNAIKVIVNNLKIERFIIKMHFYCFKTTELNEKSRSNFTFLTSVNCISNCCVCMA